MIARNRSRLDVPKYKVAPQVQFHMILSQMEDSLKTFAPIRAFMALRQYIQPLFLNCQWEVQTPRFYERLWHKHACGMRVWSRISPVRYLTQLQTIQEMFLIVCRAVI